MNLADVMDQVGDRLATITGLRVFRYPPNNLQPPAAVVSYPESYDFDATYGRGADRLTLPVVVVVGKASDRASRDNLAIYVDGSGASSVKAVLESGTTYTAFDTIRVTSVEFDVVTIAATDHMAAMFNLDITGQGS